MNVHKILCPVDFSDRSRTAVAYATTLAKQSNAEMHLVYVHEEAPVEGGFAGYVPLDETDQERAELMAMKPNADEVSYVHKFLHGDPQYQIVKYAEDNDIDLIVIATHGRTGVMRLLMGSVAEAVVRRATCPVITVKNPAESVVDAEPVENPAAAAESAG